MDSAFTVGALMDALEKLNPQTPVITDSGDTIFTIAAEPDPADGMARVAAMSLAATETDAHTVEEVQSMFAYYNVPSPRNPGPSSACRTSPVVLRPMGGDERIITSIDDQSDRIVLNTVSMPHPDSV